MDTNAESFEKRPIWEEIESEGDSRRFHTSTLINNYIITFGGIASYSKILQDFSVFNIDTYEWEDVIIKGVQPKPRWSHTACVLDNKKIIIYGGIQANDDIAQDILILTPDFQRSTLLIRVLRGFIW